MNMFSATDSVGQQVELLVDRDDARAPARLRAGEPDLARRRPRSCRHPGSAPARILSRVDLPAPFSPEQRRGSRPERPDRTRRRRAPARRGSAWRSRSPAAAVRPWAALATGAGAGAARLRRRARRYFSSLSRSAWSKLSLVIAIGVSRTSRSRAACRCAGSRPGGAAPCGSARPGTARSCRRACPRGCWPAPRAEHRSQIATLSVRPRALTASIAPSAMSSLAATITSGGSPCRRARPR